MPDSFVEKDKLKAEAEYFRLSKLISAIPPNKPLSLATLATTSPIGSSSPNSATPTGYVTVGYRGSFAFGRDGLADIKFRKLTRILVSGKVTICREVFGEYLNESRDPDHGQSYDDRYTSRFYLKHLVLEQAFDALQEAGFRCVSSCGSGTSCGGQNEPLKPGQDPEELRWNHYNEFVFCRP